MIELVIAIIGGMALMGSTTIPVIISQKNKAKSEERKLLVNHQLFKEILFWVNVRVDRIDTGHIKKTYMVQKFIKIKLMEFYNSLRKVAEAVDRGEHNYDADGILNLISTCIKNYEAEALSSGIPAMFISKFGEWHSNHIETTHAAIKYICNSEEVYHGCYEKCAAVLDILLYALHLTVLDADKTMKYFNGQLEKALEKEFPFVTREEFEMSEKVQNMQIKDIKKNST